MKESTLRWLRAVIPVVVLVLALLVVYSLLSTPAPTGWMVVRASALFAYVTLFLAIVSSEYQREMRKLFGQPYMRVHHWLARVGLVLIVLHPVLIAVLSKDPRVFVPRFTPWRVLLSLGGRPALYLFFIAALAGVFRARVKNPWKVIHWLSYLAFLLAFAHAWLLGSTVATGPLRPIWLMMAVVVVIVWLHKRLSGRRA